MRNRKGKFGLEEGNEIGKRDRPRSDGCRVWDNKRLRSSFPFFFEGAQGREEQGYSLRRQGWKRQEGIQIHGSTECLIGLRWISEVCSVVVSRRARNGERNAEGISILGRHPSSTWESILAADYEDIRAWFLPRIKRYLIQWNSLILIFPRIIADPLFLFLHVLTRFICYFTLLDASHLKANCFQYRTRPIDRIKLLFIPNFL